MELVFLSTPFVIWRITAAIHQTKRLAFFTLSAISKTTYATDTTLRKTISIGSEDVQTRRQTLGLVRREIIPQTLMRGKWMNHSCITYHDTYSWIINSYLYKPEYFWHTRQGYSSAQNIRIDFNMSILCNCILMLCTSNRLFKDHFLTWILHQRLATRF